MLPHKMQEYHQVFHEESSEMHLPSAKAMKEKLQIDVSNRISDDIVKISSSYPFNYHAPCRNLIYPPRLLALMNKIPRL